MKKIKHIACAFFIATGLTGCSDFLEILPMNEVVLENYWTDKNDVTSTVYSCYEVFESEDFLTRMGVWGELRSDNVKIGVNVPNEINEILKENLQPSNPMCNWSVFYKAINHCNTVCHYAPMVQAIDPNYTESEMRANIAEVKTLRALCYFYLIRTFRDVPYTTEPSIDDSQNYIIPAMPFNDVLDSLIVDLESVQNDAVRRYYQDESPNARYNSSRITRTAIHALLADLYLWKGDWDNCIKYCDLVIDFKRQQYDEMLEREGTIRNIGLFGNIPLILEKTTGSTACGNAYTEIFGEGGSFESIFELYFENNQSQQNAYVSKFYGNTNDEKGRLGVPDFLRKDVALGTNTVFKKTDARAYTSAMMDNQSYYPRKYVYSRTSYDMKSINKEDDLKFDGSIRGNNYANWIIYRLTDVMLMKAEAMIQRGSEEYPAAFALINVVNKRANDVTTTTRSDTLKMGDYVNSKASMEELLLVERQREFLFEGKRWFDLVRVARRDSSNTRLISLATRKYLENQNSIKIKLANPNIIYFPYAKNELKVNPLLRQNPAYAHFEDTELTTKN